MSNERRYTTLTQSQADALTEEDWDELHGNQTPSNSSPNGNAPYIIHWVGSKPTFLWGDKSGEELTHAEVKSKIADPQDELYRPPLADF